MILPSKSTTTHIETHFDTTGRAEAEAFLSEIENDGAKAGEVFAEVAAKAESANTSAGELAGRVSDLEGRITSLEGRPSPEPSPTVVFSAQADERSARNPRSWVPAGHPWEGRNWSRLKPPAGVWLIELLNPWDFEAKLTVGQTVVASATRGVALYQQDFDGVVDMYVTLPTNNFGKPVTIRATPIVIND